MFKQIAKMLYLKCKYRGKGVVLNSNANITMHSFFEGSNVINKNTTFNGYLGYGSYIGMNSNISGYVGKYCSIASNVKVITGRHPTNKFVSTHPAFFSLLKQCGETYIKEQKYIENIFADDKNNYSVVIGNDVWIGENVSIMAGVKVEDGAIIAAGAIVTKDVEPYSIMGGIPAKEIKKRFTLEEIKFLLEFKWWEKPIDWIKENAYLFDNIVDFMEVYVDEDM